MLTESAAEELRKESTRVNSKEDSDTDSHRRTPERVHTHLPPSRTKLTLVQSGVWLQ
jgi:hypothetical protein